MFKDKIKADSVVALKSHDNKKVDVLRFLISLIDKKEMQLPPGEMKEADEVVVLRKELKNKEESKEMFAKANRNDLVEQLDYEIEIVKEYLPQMMKEEDVAKIVDEVVAKMVPPAGGNFGLVMKDVMAKTQGQLDGSIVSRIVKEKISG